MSDGRTRDEHGRLLEETGIAIPRWPTDWGYVSRAPYRVQRHDQNDHPMAVECWDAPDMEYALGVFVEVALPELPEITVAVMDERFQVILGYVSAFGGLENAGAPQWFGTAEAFSFLARWTSLNPVDLAIWESLARSKM